MLSTSNPPNQNSKLLLVFAFNNIFYIDRERLKHQASCYNIFYYIICYFWYSTMMQTAFLSQKFRTFILPFAPFYIFD